MRLAMDLKEGDQFLSHEIIVTVVRGESEPANDRFGTVLFRLWCRREDTGAEGWMTFGPGGVVQDA